jgi:predicted nucleic acid-binding protein
MNIFLDTSVVVKLYHQEQGSETLLSFLNTRSSDLVLTLSDLTPIELWSAFYKRMRMNEIDHKKIKMILKNFENDARLLNIVEINKTIKTRARQLLSDHGTIKSIRTLDALQLATAIISNEHLPIDFFLAADKNLLDTAKIYFQIYNPTEPFS